MCQSKRCTHHIDGVCMLPAKDSNLCEKCEEAKFVEDAEKAKQETEKSAKAKTEEPKAEASKPKS